MTVFILVLLVAAIIFYKRLPEFAGGTQNYFDFIIENTSGSGLNKSGELRLIWILMFAGLIILCFLWFKYYKKEATDIKITPYIPMLLFPFLAYFIIFGKFSTPLFLSLIIIGIGLCCSTTKTPYFLITYLFTYYAILSCCHVLLHFSDHFIISNTTLLVLTVLIGTILSILMNRCPFILLLLQAFFPLLLSVYLIDEYKYQDELIKVPYATGYYIFFGVLIVFSLSYCVLIIIKKWSTDSNKNVSYYIHAFTPMLLFAYHSFSATPMFAQPDQHHHGEQMIPWNQLFLYGRTLYDEYTPVSGLFPFLNGSIQHVLLDGTVTDYAPAISITMLLICFVTMYLIYLHVGGGYSVLFATLFILPCYNRQYLVLPTLLLLALPKLLKKEDKWLLTWIAVSFIGGLYYPLYGAATLLATLPIAIYQVLQIIKKKSYKVFLKQKIFYLLLFLLIIPITFCMPMLYRMLVHTLTYSEQTVLADGINIYRQTIPSFFMNYLDNIKIRNLFYVTLRFALPIAFVWLFAFGFIKSIRNKIRPSLFYLAGAITLCISYTYTFVREDYYLILSRTSFILTSVGGIFLSILLLKNKKLAGNSLACFLLFGMTCAIPYCLHQNISAVKAPAIWTYPNGDAELFMDDTDKLFSYYEVPGNFIKSSDSILGTTEQAYLGNGFMVEDQMSYIQNYASVRDKCATLSREVTYLGMDGQGFYDYVGIPCCATGYLPAARSYAAQMEIWDVVSKEQPVVFFIEPSKNYYIFRNLINDGYQYVAEDSAFYPKDLYAELYANEPSDDYREVTEPLDLGLSASSFGSSLNTLQNILQNEKNRFYLPSTFDGTTYDCLYLTLDKSIPFNSIVSITWVDSLGETFNGNTISCLAGNGTLLIPVGMNPCWLLSSIDDFKLEIKDADGTIMDQLTYQELKNAPQMLSSSSSAIQDFRFYSIKGK